MRIKGQVKLEMVNLMGYTLDNQMFYVQNAGGMNGWSVNTFHFLEGICKKGWLDLTSQGMIIVRGRIAAFRKYCEANGFQLVGDMG